MLSRLHQSLLILILTALLSGCGGLIANQVSRQLENAIRNNQNTLLVAEALPAYLLLVQGLLEDDPNNANLLLAHSNLQSAYANLHSSDALKMLLVEQSFRDAEKAYCVEADIECPLNKYGFDEFQAHLNEQDLELVGFLYQLGASWAERIRANRDDFLQVAALPKVRAIMERVVTLNEQHAGGSAHLYLGVLSSLLPEALGGDFKKANEHFERALTLTDGNNLMARVLQAEQIDAPKQDKKAFTTKLHRVIHASPSYPGLTLQNRVAQQKAIALLEQMDELFVE